MWPWPADSRHKVISPVPGSTSLPSPSLPGTSHCQGGSALGLLAQLNCPSPSTQSEAQARYWILDAGLGALAFLLPLSSDLPWVPDFRARNAHRIVATQDEKPKWGQPKVEVQLGH